MLPKLAKLAKLAKLPMLRASATMEDIVETCPEAMEPARESRPRDEAEGGEEAISPRKGTEPKTLPCASGSIGSISCPSAASPPGEASSLLATKRNFDACSSSENQRPGRQSRSTCPAGPTLSTEQGIQRLCVSLRYSTRSPTPKPKCGTGGPWPHRKEGGGLAKESKARSIGMSSSSPSGVSHKAQEDSAPLVGLPPEAAPDAVARGAARSLDANSLAGIQEPRLQLTSTSPVGPTSTTVQSTHSACVTL
mmetsp:Transcript_22537/g.48127  ORF Transcript_22537/g.48127 Transcript_22537/m.48127 type:complete len:251 (-) Transcript_22537:180-932(-)